MGSRKLFFTAWRAPPGSPRFHALCRGISARDAATIASARRSVAPFGGPARAHAAGGPPARFRRVATPVRERPITNLQGMARQRAVFPRDTGLQTRMLLTLFLLGLLYVAFVGVLVT